MASMDQDVINDTLNSTGADYLPYSYDVPVGTCFGTRGKELKKVPTDTS